MSRFCLLGENVAASLSPKVHYALCGLAYETCSVPRDAFAGVLKNGPWDGYNVTIPYKTEALGLCDRVSDLARAVGCVNTVIKQEDGLLFGDNTDVAGIAFSLRHSGVDVKGKKALVFGRGGAARAMTYALTQNGAQVHRLARDEQSVYRVPEEDYDAAVLVNATPLGSRVFENETVCDLSLFPALEAVFDAVYDPLRTRFVCEALERGIPALGGLSMLVGQAAAADRLFCGAEFDDETLKSVYEKILVRRGSVVLIGLPGCGKTTVGRALANAVGRPFVDTDDLVLSRTGKTPEQILKTDGEETFRRLENEAVREATTRHGCVIATGGGAVTDPVNRLRLRKDGLCVWIKRPLEVLAVSGRPLSNDIGALAAAREPYYAACADVVVEAGTVPETVAAIRKEAHL